jgi:4-diphosphocytidyl-2-C-methyl-D-erythritol kinase
MIVFPHAKINIGLNVLRKREDGFHEIESIFFPISLCDSLEFVTAKKTTICNTGLDINTKESDNIVIKAYELLKKDFKLPPLSIHLHKVIPFGAGLGGGSSDAAFFLKAANDYFSLNITKTELKKYAEKLGSDCIFFLQDKPAFVTGRGEIISPIELKLDKYWLMLIKPDIFIGTPEAFGGIKPNKPKEGISKLIFNNPNGWKETIYNDFEKHIFVKHAELKHIKNAFYTSGATFASMSGSGSSIFGLFDKKPEIETFRQYGFIHLEKIK